MRSTEKATLNVLQQPKQNCSDNLWLSMVNCRTKKNSWNGIMRAARSGLTGC